MSGMAQGLGVRRSSEDRKRVRLFRIADRTFHVGPRVRVKLHLVLVRLVPVAVLALVAVGGAGPPPVADHLLDVLLRHLQHLHAALVLVQHPPLPVVRVELLMIKPRQIERRVSRVGRFVIASLVALLLVATVEMHRVGNELLGPPLRPVVDEALPVEAVLPAHLADAADVSEKRTRIEQVRPPAREVFLSDRIPSRSRRWRFSPFFDPPPDHRMNRVSDVPALPFASAKPTIGREIADHAPWGLVRRCCCASRS